MLEALLDVNQDERRGCAGCVTHDDENAPTAVSIVLATRTIWPVIDDFLAGISPFLVIDGGLLG